LHSQPTRERCAPASRLANRSAIPCDVLHFSRVITHTTTLEQYLDLLAGAGVLVGPQVRRGRLSSAPLQGHTVGCRSRTPSQSRGMATVWSPTLAGTSRTQHLRGVLLARGSQEVDFVVGAKKGHSN
jgi:hypothetical protein